MAISSITNNTSTSSSTIPDEFLCPITRDIMRRPLMCRSGISFDRSAILTWISEHHNTCPLTRQSLRPSDLAPNRALESRIFAWCQEHNVDYHDPSSSDTRLPEEAMLLTCLAADLERWNKKQKELLLQDAVSVMPSPSASSSSAPSSTGRTTNEQQRRNRRTLRSLVVRPHHR